MKRNALADQAFESFAALEQYLGEWMTTTADQRRHGTTREAPLVRFDRDERAALRSLPVRALPRREQRLRRWVATDAFVDIDTVRYSVPHRLVRDHVDVVLDEHSVTIFHGPRVVATHARSTEPFARVVDPTHYDGFWRRPVIDHGAADRLLSYSKPKLLIIDELGYLPFERRSAHRFFQLVARRDERGSLLITTNQLVTQWGAVFGDDVLAAAILDRLLHHSHTLMIQGESYRLKQKKKAGLLGRTPPSRT